MPKMPIRPLLAVLALSSLSGALAGGAGAPVTPAGSVGAVLPGTLTSVAAALRAAGYRVTVEPQADDEDPSMTVQAGGREVQVWLSGCASGRCARATAELEWDAGEDGGDTDLLNEWNSEYYTQAYVYEGSYYLDSTLFMGGGFTAATLRAWMTEFLSDAGEFEDTLR